MNNKRSYLDSINAGRRRRPNPSFQDMDRTLARLEGRGDTGREAYQAPRRNDRQRYRDEEFSSYPEQYERFETPRGEARRDPLDSLARDMGRARQQEDSLGAVTRVASELQALREELRQQMGQGLRREFDSLRSDIERLSVMAPSANAGEIGAEFERLSDAVRSLSERSRATGTAQVSAGAPLATRLLVLVAALGLAGALHRWGHRPHPPADRPCQVLKPDAA